MRVISVQLKGNQNIHKMKCLGISYTVLVLASVILNCSLQLCGARPEDVKKSSENQTVDVQFGLINFCYSEPKQ